MARRYVVLAIPESGLFYKSGCFRTGKGMLLNARKLTIFNAETDAEAHRRERQQDANAAFNEPVTMVVVETDLVKKVAGR